MTRQRNQATEEPAEYTVKQKALEEGLKLHFDACKHLTTLSTGSILILVGFLEKIFTNPMWKGLIIAALGLFVLSIIASVMSMMALASAVRDVTSVGRFSWKTGFFVMGILVESSHMSFITGILCLVSFAIKNLYF